MGIINTSLFAGKVDIIRREIDTLLTPICAVVGCALFGLD